jgi:peptidase M28-like protein
MRAMVMYALLASCSRPPQATAMPDATSSPDAPHDTAPSDPVGTVFGAVDTAQLRARLEELTGGTTVTVDGSSFRITNRYTPAAKANFRAYWSHYMTALGATVGTTTFPIPNLVGETQGHNVEAILPGRSPDSVVIIVHYDSTGTMGQETLNPGADDDGTGVAMQMEAARLFAQYSDRAKTVRFVAADYEEISSNLAGDYAYATYLQQQAQADGFQILVASDNDQTGWSCWSEGLCPDSRPVDSTFMAATCSGDAHNYDYPELAQGLADVATKYSTTIHPTKVCDGSARTDHYPFWVAGIPAYVLDEWGVDQNPHYDYGGTDTIDTIDFELLTGVAKIQIAFQAKLAGIGM